MATDYDPTQGPCLLVRQVNQFAKLDRDQDGFLPPLSRVCRRRRQTRERGAIFGGAPASHAN